MCCAPSMHRSMAWERRPREGPFRGSGTRRRASPLRGHCAAQSLLRASPGWPSMATRATHASHPFGRSSRPDGRLSTRRCAPRPCGAAPSGVQVGRTADLVSRLYRHHGEGSRTERGIARIGAVDDHIKTLRVAARRTQNRDEQTDAVSAIRDVVDTGYHGFKVSARFCRAGLCPPSETGAAVHVAPASDRDTSLPVAGFDVDGVRRHFYANRPRIAGANGRLTRGGSSNCSGTRPRR